MQKPVFVLGTLVLGLSLSACGGGTPAPQPQPAPQPKPAITLYQGVWGYAYDEGANGTIEQSGAALFVDEVQGGYGRVAVGAYSNEAQTRQGGALLGPISGAGHLEVAFMQDTSSNVRPYLVGQDSDNQLGSYQGHPIFAGLAGITDAAGNVLSTGAFVLVQVSTEKPATAQAQAALQQQANHLAAQRLSSGLAAQTLQTHPDFSTLQLNAAELLRR